MVPMEREAGTAQHPPRWTCSREGREVRVSRGLIKAAGVDCDWQPPCLLSPKGTLAAALSTAGSDQPSDDAPFQQHGLFDSCLPCCIMKSTAWRMCWAAHVRGKSLLWGDMRGTIVREKPTGHSQYIMAPCELVYATRGKSSHRQIHTLKACAFLIRIRLAPFVQLFCPL